MALGKFPRGSSLPSDVVPTFHPHSPPFCSSSSYYHLLNIILPLFLNIKGHNEETGLIFFTSFVPQQNFCIPEIKIKM